MKIGKYGINIVEVANTPHGEIIAVGRRGVVGKIINIGEKEMDNKITVSVRLTPSTIIELDEIGKLEKRSRTFLAEEAILGWIEEYRQNKKEHPDEKGE